MNSESKSDVRRYERFELLDYAMVHPTSGGEPFRSVVVDIGLGGVQLRSKEQLPAGEHCMLHIGQSDKPPLVLAGEVRYSKPDEEKGLYSSGFKFLPANHEERAAIAGYVHSVFMRQVEAIGEKRTA